MAANLYNVPPTRRPKPRRTAAADIADMISLGGIILAILALVTLIGLAIASNQGAAIPLPAFGFDFAAIGAGIALHMAAGLVRDALESL